MHPLKNNNRRPTFKHLVCDGLKFCCLWMFFNKYRQTGLIAARLGCTDRAVRYNKEKWKAGEFKCEECTGCLKLKLSKPL